MIPLANFTSWFTELDALLVSNRCWWQLQPFHHRQCYWAESEVELTSALMALTDEQVTELDADSEQLAEWISRWIPEAATLLRLSQLPKASHKTLLHETLPHQTLLNQTWPQNAPPARMAEGIPGRKWQQLLAFVEQIPEGQSPALEWCAGKGHLGRLMSALQGRPVNSLEWQSKLCAQGEQQALHWGLPQRFTCADAFSESSAQQVQAGEQVMALHACGELHTSLMRHWGQSIQQQSNSQQGGQGAKSCTQPEPSRLSLSPCCYHLIGSEFYEPLSAAAKASQLRLSRADLQLPLQQSVTAGAHVRRRGEQETLWRLAFDELQRDWRGVDEYLPLPNLKKSLLGGGFEAFARWAFEKKSLLEFEERCASLPIGGSLTDEYLARGAERLKLTRRMELVTHLFRRPLEIWLALDRVLFLSEQGAKVSLSTFCEPALTPRNIFIHAER